MAMIRKETCSSSDALPTAEANYRSTSGQARPSLRELGCKVQPPRDLRRNGVNRVLDRLGDGFDDVAGPPLERDEAEPGQAGERAGEIARGPAGLLGE